MTEETKMIRNIAKALGAALAMSIMVPPALADDDGDHNPEELSLAYFAEKIESGRIGPMASMHAYAAAKHGDNVTARRLFKILAERGDVVSMTWMAWLCDNGLGGPESAAAAAEWDKKAMLAGDPIGTFNYGLDLMRGRGVEQDVAEARRMVDRAAALGDATAKLLQANDYDLDQVTPDADNWKYNPYLY